jgi:hypothetical protein
VSNLRGFFILPGKATKEVLASSLCLERYFFQGGDWARKGLAFITFPNISIYNLLDFLSKNFDKVFA